MTTFEVGRTILFREMWHGLFLSARPVVVVEDDGDLLVTWAPAGTIGCHGTSHGMPERALLPRHERQLVTLESCEWKYRGAPSRGSTLAFLRAGSWAAVVVTWRANGTFLHWYVNFQLPMQRFAAGYDTADLVLDIVVAPDLSWTWKDLDPYRSARERGIVSPEQARAIDEEAEKVKAAIEARSGPFDPKWLDWRPPATWSPPQLPDGFAEGLPTPPGATVTLDSVPLG